MQPTIGRTVIYKLSEQDAVEINRRRTNSYSIADRIKEDKWPIGAQAHIGNEVQTNEAFPMIITKVWSENCINGQVLLDGTDQFWKTSAPLGTEQGTWNWPVIPKPETPKL